jgi:hypothetical protein
MLGLRVFESHRGYPLKYVERAMATNYALYIVNIQPL